MFLAPLLGSSQEMTKSLSAEEGREGESDKHTDRCYTNWSRQICTYVIRQIRYTSEQGKSAQICILCYINFSALTLGVKKIWLQICVKISLKFQYYFINCYTVTYQEYSIWFMDKTNNLHLQILPGRSRRIGQMCHQGKPNKVGAELSARNLAC